MKAGQIISLVDELKENDINDEAKLFWLNEVEGRVNTEIFKRNPGEIRELVSLDDELSIPMPYSRMYVLYLHAMIAFWEGNYDAYFTVISEFEKAVSDYSRYLINAR